VKQRPKVDRSLSTKAQQMETLVWDMAEALEDIWEDLYYLEALSKGAGSDPEAELMARAQYIDAQRVAVGKLQGARSAVVGVRHALARLTGRVGNLALPLDVEDDKGA